MRIVKAQLFASERKRFPVMGYAPDIGPLFFDDPAETDAGGIVEDHDIVIIDNLRHDISLYRGALGVPKVYLVAQFLKKEQKYITDLLDPRSACRIMIHDPHAAILSQAKAGRHSGYTCSGIGAPFGLYSTTVAEPRRTILISPRTGSYPLKTYRNAIDDAVYIEYPPFILTDSPFATIIIAALDGAETKGEYGRLFSARHGIGVLRINTTRRSFGYLRHAIPAPVDR